MKFIASLNAGALIVTGPLLHIPKGERTSCFDYYKGLATDLQCALQLIREQQAQIDGYQQQLITTINPERHSRFFK